MVKFHTKFTLFELDENTIASRGVDFILSVVLVMMPLESFFTGLSQGNLLN